MCRLITTILFSLIVLSVVEAETIKNIESPNGLYGVNNKGIYEISVVGGKAKDDSYEVRFYSVISIYSVIKPGDLTARGWWYPHLQQFQLQDYERIMGHSQCNSWGEWRWSFKYEPASINLSDSVVSIYKEVGKFHPEAKPKDFCLGVRIDTQTCERARCNQWEVARPKRFIVKSKEDALKLFSILR